MPWLPAVTRDVLSRRRIAAFECHSFFVAAFPFSIQGGWSP